MQNALIVAFLFAGLGHFGLAAMRAMEAVWPDTEQARAERRHNASTASVCLILSVLCLYLSHHVPGLLAWSALGTR